MDRRYQPPPPHRSRSVAHGADLIDQSLDAKLPRHHHQGERGSDLLPDERFGQGRRGTLLHELGELLAVTDVDHASGDYPSALALLLDEVEVLVPLDSLGDDVHVLGTTSIETSLQQKRVGRRAQRGSPPLASKNSVR